MEPFPIPTKPEAFAPYGSRTIQRWLRAEMFLFAEPQMHVSLTSSGASSPW